MTDTDKELTAVRDAYKAMDLKFGKDMVILDISGISSMADYFIIATGGSSLQVQALAAAAEDAMARHGYPLRHSEGLRSANWALLDFGDVIVHIFDKENRAFYSLERVWGDAKTVAP